jgi:hypothetical protein
MTEAIREGLLGLQIDESKKSMRPSKAGSEPAARQALWEDYEHWAKKNYPNLFGVQAGPDGKKRPGAEKEVNDRLVFLAKLDPTIDQSKKPDEILKSAQGPYMKWLIRCLKNSSYEEVGHSAHEYRDQLSAFDDLKKRNRLPSDKRDIMRYKDLHELMSMLQGLGGDFASDDDSGVSSDFKQELQDIRGFLCKLCRLEDSQIDSSVQKWSDIMDYVGGNSKWEIWAAKSFWATMIFDRWGNGAGWCVGGMLGNNYGMDQVRQAQRYYANYSGGGATYVCFQQTDKNAPRPDNKFLITLGPNGSEPEYGNYQFNNADNVTQRSGNEWGNDAQMDAFGAFLVKEGLYDILKGSRFSGCDVFQVEENKKRLEAGEPYEYFGGKIRDTFKPLIGKIAFKDSSGRDRVVDAKASPAFLELKSIDDFTLAADLAEGKPYVFDDGSKRHVTPANIRPFVKEILIPDSYSYTVMWNQRTGEKDQDGNDVLESVEYVGIPPRAFDGCKSLRKVVVSANVIAFCEGWAAVNGCHRGSSYMEGVDVAVELHGRKARVVSEEREWFVKHVTVVPGPVRDQASGMGEALDESTSMPAAAVGNGGALTSGEDLNSRLLAKIDAISLELAKELERNGFGDEIDPELIRQDMIRDCGLMGDIISVSELDVGNNPFDAETKKMHDEMRIDPQMAANELLMVTPEEFSRRIISGLMAERRAIAAGRGRLGGPRGAIGDAPRQLGRH